MLILEDRIFTRFEAGPPTSPGYYPGVLIIEVGAAKGHYAVKEESGRVANFNAGNPAHATLQKYPIHITEDTLDDVVKCGNEDENAKCKLNHGDKVDDIVGSYTTFRRDGDKVRADLSLDSDLNGFKQANTLIKKFSRKIGNSIDFDYQYEICGDKAIARCIKLNSVDIVDTPAATKAFFSQKPSQTTQYDMPLSPEDLAQIGGVVNNAITASESRMATNFSAAVDKAVKSRFEEEKEKEDDDEEKKKKKCKENCDDDKKDKEQMASLVATATLSAVKTLFPTLKVENLGSTGALPNPEAGAGETYAAKFKACKELGLSDTAAVRHIADKWPALYNSQLASGGSTTKL